jgi:glycosyltransferase involved in cell wall biosynthesis
MFNIISLLENHGHEVVPFSIKSRLNKENSYEKYFAEPLGAQDSIYFGQSKKTIRFAVDVIARLFYSWQVKSKLELLIRDTNPDAAYLLHHYNKLSPSVIDACKKYNIPVYMRLSDFFLICPQAHMLRDGHVCEKCVSNGKWSAVKHRCVKGSFAGSLMKVAALWLHRKVIRIYDRVDGIVCTTNFMKKIMVRDGWPDCKLHIIPSFVYFDNDRNITKKESKEKYIIYFGRFVHEKGVDILVNAYIKAFLKDLGVKLYLIGGEINEIRELLKYELPEEYVVEHIVVKKFLSHDELMTYVSNSLYVVVPSRWYENLPNTVLEAYANGKAVIAMDIGSMPDVVINNKTGLLFEKENEDDLKEKMELLYSDEDMRDEFTTNIKKELEKYSPNNHYKKLLSLMENKGVEKA